MVMARLSLTSPWTGNLGFQGLGFREGSGVSGYVGVSKNWERTFLRVPIVRIIASWSESPNLGKLPYLDCPTTLYTGPRTTMRPYYEPYNAH